MSELTPFPNLFAPLTLPPFHVVQTVINEVKLRYFRIDTFQPKIKMQLNIGNFSVRTARNGNDLRKLLQFRYDVFFRTDATPAAATGARFDVDGYDLVADHLMVERAGEVIGTYRILHSDNVDQFYSETEFHLEALLGLPGKKLELGRASIHPGHRSGTVLGLLWRGLGEYLVRSSPDFIFGCSSAKTMDPAAIQRLSRTLNTEFADPEIRVFPRLRFRVPRFAPENSPRNLDLESRPGVPPLLDSYLALGARVCGEPALDRDFQCVDFLTVLRRENIAESFQRKYMKNSSKCSVS